MNSVSWEKFDPELYVHDNYLSIHDEDRQIIDILVPFIERLGRNLKVLDAGSGPNLYPSLLVLPISSKIDCLEIEEKNVTYLGKQLRKLDRNWKIFWKYLQTKSQIYRDCNETHSLSKLTEVYQQSLFDFGKSNYDLVMMFFVAESITDKYGEFISVCRKFVSFAKKGGNLVAVFMENSLGYQIGNENFPAVSVTEKDIRRIFSKLVDKLELYWIPPAEKPLRAGYSGMNLMTAVKK